MIEASTQGKLLVPRTLHQGNSNSIVCLINLTDWYVDVKEGSIISEAVEVEVPQGDPIGVKQVQAEHRDDGTQRGATRTPEDLFERFKGPLSEKKCAQLAHLLTEFSDVFAQNEFDLEKFTAIEHAIDIGNHPSLKQDAVYPTGLCSGGGGSSSGNVGIKVGLSPSAYKEAGRGRQILY